MVGGLAGTRRQYVLADQGIDEFFERYFILFRIEANDWRNRLADPEHTGPGIFRHWV